MKLTAREVARLIDISAVKTPYGEAEIRERVANAKEFRFVAVHALPGGAVEI
jgi:deoxyribose-phosphate aldolase